jgi:peptidoglycan hydrolase CwlO-like protein
MESDSFSSKEILLQLMTKMDSIASAVSKQELLLNTIHEASAGRDEKIKDLRNDVKTLQDEVITLTKRIESLKTFRTTVMAFWAAFVVFISMFGRDIFNKVFFS